MRPDLACLLLGAIALFLFALAAARDGGGPADALVVVHRRFRLDGPPVRAAHSSAPEAVRLSRVVGLDFAMLRASTQRDGRRVRVEGRGYDSFVVPISYSDEDQGFVALVRVGQSNVYAVLDSGSSDVAVASAKCIKDNLCSARDAGYDPEASPTAVRVNDQRNLSYGTLEIRAQKYRDTLSLRCLQELDRCATTPPDVTDFEQTGEALVPDAYIAAATEMRGTDSNILGLMMPAARDSPYPCMLDMIFSQLFCERRWGCALGTHGRGWFVLGSPPEACMMRDPVYLPLSNEYSYLGAYVLDVEAMRAGPSANQLSALERFPRFVVLDTGTSDTYVTRAYAQALRDAGLGSGAGWLEISFRGGAQLVFGPARQAHGGRETLHLGADAVNRLFGDDAPVMLMGCHWMQGLFWDFCLDRRCVGVSEYV